MSEKIDLLNLSPINILETIKNFNINHSALSMALGGVKDEIYGIHNKKESMDDRSNGRYLESDFIMSTNSVLSEIGLLAKEINTSDGVHTQGGFIPGRAIILCISSVQKFQDAINDNPSSIGGFLCMLKGQIDKYGVDVDFSFEGDEIKEINTNKGVMDSIVALEAIDISDEHNFGSIVGSYRNGEQLAFLLGEKYINSVEGLRDMNINRPEFGWLTNDWNKAITISTYISIRSPNLGNKYLDILQSYFLDLYIYFQQHFPNGVEFYNQIDIQGLEKMNLKGDVKITMEDIQVKIFLGRFSSKLQKLGIKLPY